MTEETLPEPLLRLVEQIRRDNPELWGLVQHLPTAAAQLDAAVRFVAQDVIELN